MAIILGAQAQDFHDIAAEVMLQCFQKHLTLSKSNSDNLHAAFETVTFPKEPL